MSLLDGLKAPTPFHFKCPHCRARLRVQMRWLLLLMLIIVCLFAGLGLGCLAAWRTFGRKGFIVGLLFCVAAWVLAEMLTGITVYTYGRLVPGRTTKKNV